ncbi:MAG: zinc ribbon domain-containing protein [Chloroflexi bacterium]|nr:zinc ribbon domain-containing protein [Chloroflexota bacterium]MCL5076115.1 zinc ribbon domain-containing protein [Chloroflexota bacterium]
MPIYEYRCEQCGRLSAVFRRNYESPVALSCPYCGHRELQKLISRFAVARSEESRLESLADPSKLGDVDESDPRSVARWARRMGRELGDELGNGFEEMTEQIASGELPPEGVQEEANDGLF